MTNTRLNKIRSRLEGSTHGNWKVFETDEGTCIGTTLDHPQLKSPNPVVSISTWVKEPHKRIYIRKEDAEFIAHAKQDVDWLLKEIKRLEKERTKAYQEGYKQGKFDELMDEF